MGHDHSHVDLRAGARHASRPSTPVLDVHDLHVWTLTSDMEVLTAHLGIASGADSQTVLQRARTVLSERFHLAHATLQVETAGNHDCEEMTW